MTYSHLLPFSHIQYHSLPIPYMTQLWITPHSSTCYHSLPLPYYMIQLWIATYTNIIHLLICTFLGVMIWDLPSWFACPWPVQCKFHQQWSKSIKWFQVVITICLLIRLCSVQFVLTRICDLKTYSANILSLALYGTVISVQIFLYHFGEIFKKKKSCIFLSLSHVTCDNVHIRKLTCLDSRNNFPFKKI